MRAIDIIAGKRDGATLSEGEIGFFIRGVADGSVPDYQAAAWLMAVYLRGMTSQETAALTRAMLASGGSLDLSGIAGPFVDKHSTGGVGDKTSLALAPAAAACGLKDPMMSGRSLGHTGGTLDKLDSIPGYRSRLEEAEFRKVLSEVGFAMTGQTERIAPADRVLYALRDATSTVESVPLITASILSKKAAEGTSSLVLDVKAGSGAFMKTVADAETLAASLCSTWKAMGRGSAALVTSMDTPLGRKVGNFLEVEEIMDCLEGRWAPDLLALCSRLGAWMMVLGGAAADPGRGEELFRESVRSGKAYEKFMQNVEAQGGDPEKLLAMRNRFRAPRSVAVASPFSGAVGGLDAYPVGLAATILGAGRSKADDPVYPDVGIIFEKKEGETVKAGETLCVLYGRTDEALARAKELVLSAYRPEAEGDRERMQRSIVIKEIQAP
jgi:pyrimidine-nucleoside phosphorylase